MKTPLLATTAIVIIGAIGLSSMTSPKTAEEPTDEVVQVAQGSFSEEPPVQESPTMLNVSASPIGRVVQDASGNTLYAFTNDTKGESTCNDKCAINWPPARKTDVNFTADGIDVSLMGTTKRKDGTIQLTLNNMPLYRFAGDGFGTGSLKGQGNGGKWFALTAEGKLNRTVLDSNSDVNVAAGSIDDTPKKSSTTTTKPRRAVTTTTSSTVAPKRTTTTVINLNRNF